MDCTENGPKFSLYKSHQIDISIDKKNYNIPRTHSKIRQVGNFRSSGLKSFSIFDFMVSTSPKSHVIRE